MSSSCPLMQYDTSYKDVEQTIKLDLCNNTALDHSEAQKSFNNINLILLFTLPVFGLAFTTFSFHEYMRISTNIFLIEIFTSFFQCFTLLLFSFNTDSNLSISCLMSTSLLLSLFSSCSTPSSSFLRLSKDSSIAPISCCKANTESKKNAVLHLCCLVLCAYTVRSSVG